MLFAIASCTTTKYIEVPIETIKTEYAVKNVSDTTIIRDSIDRYVAGDTVYIYKLQQKTRVVNTIDTVVKVDSIPYTVEVKTTVTEEVNVLKWYQKMFMCIGLLVSLFILFLIVEYFIKHKFSIK